MDDHLFVIFPNVTDISFIIPFNIYYTRYIKKYDMMNSNQLAITEIIIVEWYSIKTINDLKI